jgi:hypothetical protein
LGRLLLVAALAAASLGGLAVEAPGRAAAQDDSLVLNPAEAKGVAVPGQRIGPFGIRNTTDRTYAMKVLPVLLGQNRDGGLFVRQDPVSLERARRLLEVSGDASFRLRPGGARSLRARLLARSPDDNFYGGVLFQATPPTLTRGSGVTQVLQLNARVFLRPPGALSRTSARLTAIRAEQSAPRRLRALIGFANTANRDVRPTGRLIVRDPEGEERLRGTIEGFDVLPGAEVDLPAKLRGGVLPAGRYTMEAKVRIGELVLRLEAPLELFGPNQVATTDAQIVSFEPPQAQEGEEVEVSVRYANTGNVALAPQAQLVVDATGERVALQTAAVAAGQEGEATGTIRLEGREPRQLTARLLAEGRQLDTSTVTVTPTVRRSLTDRLSDWIAEHAVLLAALLLGLLMLATAALAAGALRRRVG